MYRCKAFLSAFLLFFATNVFANNIIKEQNDNLNFNILKALGFEGERPEEAIDIYVDVYKKTKSPIYIKEAIKVAYINKSQKLGELLNLAKTDLVGDYDYIRIKTAYLLSVKKFDDAKVLIKALIKQEPVAKNYVILGTINYMMDSNVEAKENFEKAYELEQSDENVLRLVDVFINKFGNSAEAVRYLETHRRIYGCGEKIACEALADIYKVDKKYKALVSVYESQYKASQDTVYLDHIIGVYLYLENYKEAVKILEKYGYSDKLLIELYARIGDYKKAIKKAQNEFEKTNDYEYMAMNAIYLYESNQPNISKDIMQTVIDKFENSIEKVNQAVYYNYYGYLLIDHDIDVPRGMRLVERALAKDPKSVYYIDSLAWGYYKLGDCIMAKDIMNTIKDNFDFLESDEGKKHLKAIDNCVKIQIQKAKEKANITKNDNNDTR